MKIVSNEKEYELTLTESLPQIKKMFGDDFLRKNSMFFQGYYSLFYEKFELRFDFSSDDILLAIEIYGKSTLIYDGIDFRNSKISLLVEYLKSKDQDLDISDGAISKKINIGIWAQDFINKYNSYPETIIIFKNGYYDIKPNLKIDNDKRTTIDDLFDLIK